MIINSTQKLLITMTILLVLGFFGYEMFWKNPKPLAESTDSSAEIVGEDILALVEKLRAISIDQSIFSSTLFNSLKDSSVSIISEPKGRLNPFATIGAE